MSGNNGWVGSNKPSFLKLISGMFGLKGTLGSPTSSASRIIWRRGNGVPPQYVASYLSEYQPQLGKVAAGLNTGTPPQSSKTMLRTLSGVLVSIVSILGRPLGVG